MSTKTEKRVTPASLVELGEYLAGLQDDSEMGYEFEMPSPGGTMEDATQTEVVNAFQDFATGKAGKFQVRLTYKDYKNGRMWWDERTLTAK
jgi:hypothetical protein